MWKRRILDEDQTKTVAQALQGILVELSNAALIGKQAHWNLRGDGFLSVHEKLDELVNLARSASDEVAERSVMIGVAPDGRVATIADQTGLPEFPAGFNSVSATLTLVCDTLHKTIEKVRAGIEAVEDADPVSEDMLIDISSGLEEHLWMFQALEFPPRD